MKVSVVMISYNVAKYIGQALESVANQTLKDIEIIVVDKFSTDGTREIIKSYMEKDSRIKLIDDVKGSAGYSYNAGIKEACGEYVGFVETDDYVERDMYEVLYGLATKHNLDYVKGNFNFFITDKGKDIEKKHSIFGDAWSSLYNKVLKTRDYTQLPQWDAQMWAGIYRRKYLIDNQVLLNESKGAAFQDHGFQWQAIVHAVSCMYVPNAFYHYRKDNLAASMNNPKALFMDLNELKYIKNKLQSVKNMEPDFWCTFYCKIIYILYYRLNQYFAFGGNNDMSLKKCIDEYLLMLKEGELKGLFDDNMLYEDARFCWKLMDESVEKYLLYMKKMACVYIDKEETLISFAKRMKNIVIFGNGDNGKSVYWILARNGLSDKVVVFCDNNPNKDKINENVDVTDVLTAVENYMDAGFIVANLNWADVMRKQIIKLGVKRNMIYTYKVSLPEWLIV